MSYLEKLPAKYESGDHKGEQAFVKITNDKVGRPKTNPIMIEQNRFEFPQYGPKPEYDDKGNQTNVITEDQAREAFNELAEQAGGWVRLLNYNNASIKSDAVDAGKLYIRTAESLPKADTPEQALEMLIIGGLKRTSEWSLKTTEKVTAKEMKDTVTNLLANLSNLSNDQIAEAIKALAK